MLHTIGLDYAIITLVETMLPRFSPEDLGLMITLDMRAENFDTNKHEDSIITLIFHRPGNYTKVMAISQKFSQGRFPTLLKETEIDLFSDHDSCWSSDGLEILNSDWVKKSKIVGHPRDENVHFYNSFSIFQRPKYVRFKSLQVDRDNRKVTFVIDKFIAPEKMLSFMKSS